MPEQRHLWLIRHAESPAESPGGTDFDRHLSERGQANCEALARWLADAQASRWLVTSTAKRCLLTSQALIHALGVPADHWIDEPRLYEASASTVLDVVQSIPADIDRAVIVAHNPAISAVAGMLLGMRTGVSLPPGGCVGLFGPGNWPEWRSGQCSASASWAPAKQPLLTGSSPDSQASNRIYFH